MGGGSGSVLRGAGGEKENRGMRNMDGMTREIDRLDQELLNTEVDPKLLHRTVETSRRQHVRRERSRSPMDRDRSPIRGRPTFGGRSAALRSLGAAGEAVCRNDTRRWSPALCPRRRKMNRID